jgi:hypothetical protein
LIGSQLLFLFWLFTSVGLSEGEGHYKTPALLQIGEDPANALISICGLNPDGDGF